MLLIFLTGMTICLAISTKMERRIWIAFLMLALTIITGCGYCGAVFRYGAPAAADKKELAEERKAIIYQLENEDVREALGITDREMFDKVAEWNADAAWVNKDAAEMAAKISPFMDTEELTHIDYDYVMDCLN